MPRIIVDGREIEVPEGRTLLQALDDVGLLMGEVEIPHYCWHPKLPIDGSCRLCQVEIEGAPKLQIACNTPVKDGMVVHTKTERVQRAREGVMELLLVNHPLDCPICDQAGECKLQDYAYQYGAPASRTREPRRALKKRVELGPEIVFDQERCILCRRCVRFCDEITGTGELRVWNRGDHSVLDIWPGQPLDNPYSMNVADLCPVGALTTRDFRFKIRVWFLEDVPGVCTGCARGCNIHLGVANNKVYRYLPRRNDAVNETWICDEGRLSYRHIGAAGRLREPMRIDASGDRRGVSLDAAVEEAAARIRRLIDAKGPGVFAGIASPQSTNEELFAFRRFLETLGVETLGVAVVRGESDDLLIAEEKGPNAAGARALGFPDNPALVERIRSGGIDGLLVVGHELLHPTLLGGIDALTRLDTVIAFDPQQSELQRVAHVSFPVRHAAEKLGTFTNLQDRVQRVVPAVEPSWEALGEGEILARLGAALGLDGYDGTWDLVAVAKEMSQSVPAFAGIDFDSVGELGKPLARPPARARRKLR